MKMLIAVTVAATLLSGCQSIFGTRAKLEVRPVGLDASQGGRSAALALEEGRSQLLRGELASAIASLRLASADPANAAAAHNGLAVAYAMLGRGDLAERYFQQAVAAAPEEPKYAANLARYYRSRDAELARTAATPPLNMAAPDSAVSSTQATAEGSQERVIQAGGGLRITTSAGRTAISRVSRSEVAIRTLPTLSADTRVTERRRNPRFSGVNSDPQKATYPLRIELSSGSGAP